MRSQRLSVQDQSVISGAASGISQSPGRELVSEAIALWAQGVPADAQAFLDRHPEMRHDRSVVLDLAYEEYCCRKEAGAPPDSEEFCERFPTFKASLRRLIEAHRFLEEDNPLTVGGAEVRPPRPGDTFLGFTLVRELGRGGFAQVFLATEPALGNRPVAVKISLQGAAEAETLGRLRHPNIVPVHSVREDPHTGLTAVCMPYLGSATLCNVLDHAFAGAAPPSRAGIIWEAARDPLPPENKIDDPRPPDMPPRTGTYVDGIVSLGIQLAEALAFTHAQGIFHRDLKPSNVLLTPDGKPLLLDFNLSFDHRLADQRLGGTVPYMAPEHLRAIDPRGAGDPSRVGACSDVFALGVILYECLTGVHPFGRPPQKLSPDGVRTYFLERQRSGPRPLRQGNPQVDLALARSIEACLAFDSKDRPQSAAALARALRKSLAPWRRGRRWFARHYRAGVGAAALLMLLGGVVGIHWSLREPPYLSSSRNGLEAYRQQRYAEALEDFNRAVETAPDNAEAWFARGRTQQQIAIRQWLRGEDAAPGLHHALDDFRKAERLTPNGRIRFCMGVCNSLLSHKKEAIEDFEQALRADYAPAEVFNNLAYNHLQLGGPAALEKAFGYVNQALVLKPNLAAAYHNRAWIGVRRLPPRGRKKDVQYGSALAEVLADIRQALELSPPTPETAELYADAACAYARATVGDDSWLQEALRCYHLAVVNGQDPEQLKKELCKFSSSNPHFEALSQERASQKPFRTLRVIDPSVDDPPELLSRR